MAHSPDARDDRDRATLPLRCRARVDHPLLRRRGRGGLRPGAVRGREPALGRRGRRSALLRENMRLMVRTSIRAKLALLAGVPVVGALLLALFVAHDARQQAASAASLGSIEDLARLTSYIADELHAEQDERAVLGVADGLVDAAARARLAQTTADAGRATD